MLSPPEWHLVLDSTNSYLLRKLDADPMVQSGAAVFSSHQTAGRGQRQKRWVDAPGKSLLFSVAAQPVAALAEQPLFCFGVALTVAETLEALFPEVYIQLKWPNDLYISDRKLGGILIENVLRGVRWQWAVIGLGLNLLPQSFEEPFGQPPAFLAELTDSGMLPEQLAAVFQESITRFVTHPLPTDILVRYNHRLYQRGNLQTFETSGQRWQGVVQTALPDGRLQVSEDGRERTCTHGADLWIPHPFASGKTTPA